MFDALTAILIVLFTAGLKEFWLKVFGKDLPPTATAVIVALVGALVLFGNQLAALLPANVAAIVVGVVKLIVLIGGSFGVHSVWKVATAAFEPFKKK